MDMSARCPLCKLAKPSTGFVIETEDIGEVELQICGLCGLVYAPAKPPVVHGLSDPPAVYIVPGGAKGGTRTL